VVKFWRNQKAKVHDVLVSQSIWTNKLSSVNWRIDVKTKSKVIQDLNQPAAIVELEIKTPEGKVCLSRVLKSLLRCSPPCLFSSSLL